MKTDELGKALTVHTTINGACRTEVHEYSDAKPIARLWITFEWEDGTFSRWMCWGSTDLSNAKDVAAMQAAADWFKADRPNTVKLQVTRHGEIWRTA